MVHLVGFYYKNSRNCLTCRVFIIFWWRILLHWIRQLVPKLLMPVFVPVLSLGFTGFFVRFETCHWIKTFSHILCFKIHTTIITFDSLELYCSSKFSNTAYSQLSGVIVERGCADNWEARKIQNIYDFFF